MKKGNSGGIIQMTFSRKTVFYPVLAAVVLGTVLTGCGKKTEKTDEGMAAVQDLDYATAMTCFEEAIVSGEDLELAYRGQGLCYLGQTDYESAAESFQKALSNAGMFVSDTEIDINYYLATAQYKSGDKEAAVKTLDAVIGMREKDEEAYFLRGMIKMETDDYEKAVEDLDRALSLSGQDVEMTIRIYQVFADNDHKEEGRSYLSAAVDNRLDKMSDYEKGRIYYYLEDYTSARDFLEAAESGRGAGDTETLLMLGRTYEKLGDYNYAASLYQKQLEEDAENAALYNQLGLCKLESGEYAAALNAFNSGLALENNQDVLQLLKFNQIVAYEYTGDFEKAASLMKDYLESYPDDAQAVREYDFLSTR
jgi:tetratricopeptide (TPR) repeat protein